MLSKKVRTLHIRDAVSKTFHIVGQPGSQDFDIDLHVDGRQEEIKVPKSMHKQIMQMYSIATVLADEIITEESVNISGGANEDIGNEAQRIWEELIS